MVKVRIRFKKLGSIRYISHLDTMRAFERCFRSCGFPMHFTKGYHPHPRIAFGPPLKTGWESVDEYLDIIVEEFREDFIDASNGTLPEGLSLAGAEVIPLESKSLTASITAARLGIAINEEVLDGERIGEDRALSPADIRSKLVNQMSPLEAFGGGCESNEVLKNDESDPRLLDLAVEISSGELSIEYLTTMSNGRGLNPSALLKRVFPQEVPPEDTLSVIRRGLYVGKAGQLVSPMDVS